MGLTDEGWIGLTKIYKHSATDDPEEVHKSKIDNEIKIRGSGARNGAKK